MVELPSELDAESVEFRAYGDELEIIINRPNGETIVAYVCPWDDVFEQFVEQGDIDEVAR